MSKKQLLNPISDEQFISGDIGLSSSNGWVARLIRLFTSWQTGKAASSHAFILVGENLIVEAVDKIRENPVSKYDHKSYTKTAIFRINLSNEERKALRIGLIKRVGGAYGWFKIPLFALDGIFTKITSLFGRKTPVFFFSKTLGISNIPVCSQLVVWALHKYTNYIFRDKHNHEVDWKVVSPDYLEDLLALETNHAQRIYSKTFV